MIGLGKWNFDIDLPFIQIKPTITISNNNGNYVINASISNIDAEPAAQILSIMESGNSLIIKMTYPLFNISGDFQTTLTFDGDTCKGTTEIPMIGKLSIMGTRDTSTREVINHVYC